MKVTQIIKDAITTSIKVKCEEANKGYKLALANELARLSEERRLAIKELEVEHKKAFMAMLDKLDTKNISYYYSGYDGQNKDRDHIWYRNNCNYSFNVTTDYAEDLRTKIANNENKATKFINDIILELELGANKPNLDTLLNSVTF